MIAHIPMVYALFPENALSMNSFVLEFIGFDPLFTSYVSEAVFQFSDDLDQSYNDNFEELGFDSMSSVGILGPDMYALTFLALQFALLHVVRAFNR